MLHHGKTTQEQAECGGAEPNTAIYAAGSQSPELAHISRTFTVTARALLVELASMDNGRNNGSLYLSVRDAADRLGLADLTAVSAAFDELTDLGFIELTQDSSFDFKVSEKSRARCWRLTWLAGPGRKGPTCDFRKRCPEEGSKAHKRMEKGERALAAYHKSMRQGRLPVLDSDTEVDLSPYVGRKAVLESNTLISMNGGNQPIQCVWDFATHTAAILLRDARLDWGWWQPDWSKLAARSIWFASLTHWQGPNQLALMEGRY